MSIVKEWLRQVIFCMCFLELLYQLALGAVWQKYLKFTGGLIFMLVLMQPVLDLLHLSDNIHQLNWRWQIQEESQGLQEAQKELEEFRSQQIRQGLQRELEKQMASLVEYYGGKVEMVKVTEDEENGQITEAEICLTADMNRLEECRAELCVCFGLEREQVKIQINGEVEKG